MTPGDAGRAGMDIDMAGSLVRHPAGDKSPRDTGGGGALPELAAISLLAGHYTTY